VNKSPMSGRPRTVPRLRTAATTLASKEINPIALAHDEREKTIATYPIMLKNLHLMRPEREILGGPRS